MRTLMKFGCSWRKIISQKQVQKDSESTLQNKGENFPPEAAQYAIDNLEADCKAHALEKAKTYYETMNMSKEGVRDQLVSEYGEKFTQEEADYAVNNLE